MNIKKRIASVAACALMCLPVINSTAPSFMPAPTSSIVMTMEANAASSSKKLSGKSATYVSNLINPSITICINDEKTLNNMVDFLYNTSFYTSGCKYSKAVVKYGNKYCFLGSSKALKAVERIFAVGASASKKSKKAYNKLVSMHAKSPKKGVKVTFRVLGDFKVEYQ
ncbi:MAG: hypothetical protein NC340_10580 [Ruminococcus flavefaciens]|nr:hypothetical protein [Ruminococcus flavefaciens]MCM1229855.1 hypothetical protein [Ruminococcus flavefaciens]